MHQFSQKLVSTLSKFSIKIVLGDDNYTHWCSPVYEAIRTIGCRSYLDKNKYRDETLSDEQHDQIKFVICTWILNQCDVTNGERARDELATRDPITRKNEIDYDPYKLWLNLETYHDQITKAKLAHVSKALITMTQHRSDSLKMHVEKFNTLLREYYRFRGDMTSTQAAQTLIGSLKPGYEVTIDVIYRIIKPLTYEKVKQELLDTDEEKSFTSPAMAYANHSETHSANTSHRIIRCTKEVC
ncbi:hypothetical protein CROQUDRAFT_38263, partial [Cronartium quercuum f. sp. fusiforme G11]